MPNLKYFVWSGLVAALNWRNNQFIFLHNRTPTFLSFCVFYSSDLFPNLFFMDLHNSILHTKIKSTKERWNSGME